MMSRGAPLQTVVAEPVPHPRTPPVYRLNRTVRQLAQTKMQRNRTNNPVIRQSRTADCSHAHVI